MGIDLEVVLKRLNKVPADVWKRIPTEKRIRYDAPTMFGSVSIIVDGSVDGLLSLKLNDDRGNILEEYHNIRNDIANDIYTNIVLYNRKQREEQSQSAQQRLETWLGGSE